MNEDVFVAPPSNIAEMKTMDSDIQELTEQIHRLLLQVDEFKFHLILITNVWRSGIFFKP